MDESDLFGTPLYDWDFSGAEFGVDYQDAPDSSQASEFFDEACAVPKSTRIPLDTLTRIGWQLYFPNKDVTCVETTEKHIRTLEEHYKNFRHEYSPSKAKDCKHFQFRLSCARNDLSLRDGWPTFESDFIQFPEYTVACMGLAMYRIVVAANDDAVSFLPTFEIPKIIPRLSYFGSVKSISSIDASHRDKLITIRGMIVRVNEACITGIWCTYRCKYCNDTMVLQQQYNRNTTRQWICSECRTSGGIEYSKGSVWNMTEMHINITVQCFASESKNNYSIDVKIPCGLEDSLQPGADVTITGVLKMDSEKYIEAICIKRVSVSSAIKTQFHSKEMEAIRAIRSESCPFKLLVHSLCPEVVGLETVKAGLLLALFSNSCDTHVLLADIDSGISQKLLERCISASSNGVSLNDSHRMGKSGPGVCCIERIDKLAKLEMLTSLLNEAPSRTTLLTSAMPNSRVFDGSKPFLDNFIIPRAFLERFALVFVTEDTIIPEDDIVCYDGVRLHPEKPSTSKCSVEVPLVRQFKLKPGENCDRLPIELLRKYIDYARRHCAPELTDQSTAVLENFFSQMYSMPQWLSISNGMKMVQIQNMARARARIDLSPEVSPEHVMDTIRIVSRSWYDKYDTDDRAPTVVLSPAKREGLKASGIRNFLDVLRARSVQLNTKFFTLRELRALIDEVGLPGLEDEIVEKLNMQGYLLKKSAGRYQLLV